MKKILRNALIVGLIFTASCEDYGDDFDKLNQRIDSLESQIAGMAELASGVEALDTKINAIATALDGVPDSADFSAAVGQIQEDIVALQEAIAAVDATSSDAATQVADLQTALDDLATQTQELLDANNVHQGDMFINNYVALDNALEQFAGQNTIIFDGVLEIANYEMDSTFTASKVNQITSKLKTVIGGLNIDGVDGDLDLSNLTSVAVNDGNLDRGWPWEGPLVWIDNIEGSVDMSSLKYLTTNMDIDDVEGDVDLSSLVSSDSGIDVHGLTSNDPEDWIGTVKLGALTTAAYVDIGYFNSVDLTSLATIQQLNDGDEESVWIHDIVSAVTLPALTYVPEDLLVENIVGGFSAPVLEYIGDDLWFWAGGDVVFPALTYVDDDLDILDMPADNEHGLKPMLKVDFPVLETYNYVRVYEYWADLDVDMDDYMYYDYDGDDITKNTFTEATYIRMNGSFSDDVEYEACDEGTETDYGFSAPKAETVILNSLDYDGYENYMMMEYIDAPMADVTINAAINDYDLRINFATLKADELVSVWGDLELVAVGDGEVPVDVNLPLLEEIDDYLATNGVNKLELPVYVTWNDGMDIISRDLKELSIQSIVDDELYLDELESLTITALYDEYFDLEDVHGLFLDTLKSISITGVDCDTDVDLNQDDSSDTVEDLYGCFGDWDSAYPESLETVTLGGTFDSVYIEYFDEQDNNDGLTSVTTSGQITYLYYGSNGANVNYTLNHEQGTCD